MTDDRIALVPGAGKGLGKESGLDCIGLLRGLKTLGEASRSLAGPMS